jgi:uncharacterized membrane protein
MKSKTERVSGKEFTMNVLNGLSIGVVIALVPASIFGSLMKLFGDNPVALTITHMTTFAQSLLPIIAAFAVAMLFKMTAIDAASVGLAATVASGVGTFTDKGFVLAGTGDIITIGVTIALAVAFVRLVSDHLGQFKLLLAPSLTMIVAGGIGLLALPYIRLIAQTIGQGVLAVTDLQPILMGIILGAVFAVIIVSPISSVGIATAIGLSGVASGSANLGIAAGSLVLAAMGARVNPIGGTLAHFIGSPKIQMANMVLHPMLFIPVIIVSAIMGGVGALFNVQGTAFSAGFGLSGLVGPIAALEAGSGWVTILLLYAVFPVALAIGVGYLFVRVLKVIKPEDLKLPETN